MRHRLRVMGVTVVRLENQYFPARIELFFLFVNTVPAAPPPRLMDERPVRGIHEANDAVIDAHGHVGGEVGEFVFVFFRYPFRHTSTSQ